MSSGDVPEIVTFGCRLNIVESDAIRQLAAQAGRGDLAIVNTCGVTAEASRQARQAIRRLKREQPERAIAVTGCAVEIEPAAFAMLDIAFHIPNARKTDPSFWRGLARPDYTIAPARSNGQDASTTHTRGFLEIQNGCDHSCTFCVIPVGRGASRSTPVATIIERARALVEGGIREVVLTGVDITSYGTDLPGRPTLGRLVTNLLTALPDLPRLRLSSIDCIEADAELLDAIGTQPRLMPHLHLSLQSGADLILKRMKRRHSRGAAIAFCEAIRRNRPEIVFGADLIVGFPTETEENFADSLSLVEACGLTHLHVFPYSSRPGTPAARMPAVASEIVHERAQRLRSEGERMLARHLTAQVGKSVPLLMERGGKGRTEDFTSVRVDPAPEAGLVAQVHIGGHDGRMLFGRPVT